MAGPFDHGEAAVFEVHDDNWHVIFDFLVYVVDRVNPNSPRKPRGECVRTLLRTEKYLSRSGL